MILDLIRAAVGRSAADPADGRPTTPPPRNSSRRVVFREGADYTSSLPMWGDPRSSSSGFADGSRLIPSAGAEFGNRVFQGIELRIFAESAGYKTGADDIELKQSESTNWLVSLSGEATLSISYSVQELSDWEIEHYGTGQGGGGRARFLPMTIGVFHNGFKFTLGNVIFGEDELIPDYEEGFTIFTLLFVVSPSEDESEEDSWYLLGLKHFGS